MTEQTPMMQQYLEIKQNYRDHILFFRLGDFYEMFYEDAVLASKELDLTLTGRGGKTDRAPMCGVPYHSCDGYIARLIAKGYKVAICEQMEDPATAKGIVKRDIVRVITPGTVTDGEMLEGGKNNYIAALFADQSGAGMCFADISTGEIYATTAQKCGCESEMINQLARFAPAELIINQAVLDYKEIARFLKEKLVCTLNLEDDRLFDRNACKGALMQRVGGLQAGDDEALLVPACGALITYIDETLKGGSVPLKPIAVYNHSEYMDLDINTRRHLELCETMRTKQKKGSLLSVLDRTKTSMGARMLRKWTEQPLTNLVAISARHNSVGCLMRDPVLSDRLGDALGQIGDMERLITKITAGSANGRDLKALELAFAAVPEVKKLCKSFDSALLERQTERLDPMPEMTELIAKAITEKPPVTLKEGGIIQKGFHPEVDELAKLMGNGKQILAELEAREREKTGIKNLRVSFNKVFGYYIEISKSYIGMVPQSYIRKQTLVNCERYITQELKDLESKILGAHSRICDLEYQLFCEVRDKVCALGDRVLQTADAIAVIDTLLSLANAAAQQKYVMPEMQLGGAMAVKDGRHPVVEQMLQQSLFVPNDTLLDCGENRLLMITGPNMAGKSTYMRQVALIAIMAQMGSFVPASSARLCVVDKVFTRVGASDDLSTGQSTFMVEMSEVGYILKNATAHSLIIFDEIGRGTSTYDGMSIARGVIEYVVDKKKLGAKTLFATHYHELKEMEATVEGIKNYNIAVKKRGDDITFLRKIVRGAADDSYGIEVAKLAGLPNSIILRAKEILEKLEQNDGNGIAVAPKLLKKADDSGQMALGGYDPRVTAEIKQADLNTLTPIEALNVLYRIQNLLRDSGEL